MTPEQSAELFSCEPLSCRLTRQACGRRYTLANRGAKSKAKEAVADAAALRRTPCVGCAIGRRHAAGELVDVTPGAVHAANAPDAAGHVVCAWPECSTSFPASPDPNDPHARKFCTKRCANRAGYARQRAREQGRPEPVFEPRPLGSAAAPYVPGPSSASPHAPPATCELDGCDRPVIPPRRFCGRAHANAATARQRGDAQAGRVGKQKPAELADLSRLPALPKGLRDATATQILEAAGFEALDVGSVGEISILAIKKRKAP